MPREFAPGIPDKDVFKPVREVGKEGPNEVWALSLSRHDARKAGKHYDLRLTDPTTGDAHSWALPKANWPEPGQKVLAVPQPTHTAEYAARKGKWEIAEGYGAGTVKSKMLEPVEIVEASTKKVTFNLFGPGQQVGQYSIIRTGNGRDLLVNHSPVGRQVSGPGGYAVPTSKPKYRETSFDSLDVNTDDVMQAKIDGAHVVVGLQAGKPARVFSYRESVKQPVIEHTHRIPDWNQREVPSGLGGTVLRAELWGERGGKAIPASELGGLLNTDVWKSRLQQEAKGIKLQLSPFDVEKYQGRDAGNMDWEQKRDVLQRAADSLGWLRLPPTATTPGEKKKLLKAIESGKLPETSEGVVLFPKEGPPIKAKITPEYDGTIVGTFEGRGRLEGAGAGGFLVKDESTGVVNRVGGGLNDKLRRAAYEEPGFFKGLIAKIRSRGKFPGGKMRDPRFAGFHLDKNDPEDLAEVAKLGGINPTALAESILDMVRHDPVGTAALLKTYAPAVGVELPEVLPEESKPKKKLANQIKRSSDVDRIMFAAFFDELHKIAALLGPTTEGGGVWDRLSSYASSPSRADAGTSIGPIKKRMLSAATPRPASTGLTPAIALAKEVPRKGLGAAAKGFSRFRQPLQSVAQTAARLIV